MHLSELLTSVEFVLFVVFAKLTVVSSENIFRRASRAIMQKLLNIHSPPFCLFIPARTPFTLVCCLTKVIPHYGCYCKPTRGHISDFRVV